MATNFFTDFPYRLLEMAEDSRSSLRVTQAGRDARRMRQEMGNIEEVVLGIGEVLEGTKWRLLECLSGRVLPYAPGCLAKTRDAIFNLFR